MIVMSVTALNLHQISDFHEAMKLDLEPELYEEDCGSTHASWMDKIEHALQEDYTTRYTMHLFERRYGSSDWADETVRLLRHNAFVSIGTSTGCFSLASLQGKA